MSLFYQCPKFKCNKAKSILHSFLTHIILFKFKYLINQTDFPVPIIGKVNEFIYSL